MIRILLIEDRDIIIDSLSIIFSGEPDFEIIDVARDGTEAIKKVKQHINELDVVLMDINLPEKNGIELTKEITNLNHKVKVLGYSFHENSFYIKEMIKAGAKGYITKDVGRDEYIKAIRCVAGGSVYFSPKVANLLLNDYMKFLSLAG